MNNINSVINKAKYILSEEGMLIFFDRLIRVSIVKMRRFFNDNSENIQKWKNSKNKFIGNRAFLIGNGPSLNRTPLYLLKNEYTMGFNRFNLMFERLDWVPNFYCNIDDRVLMDMIQEINDSICKQCHYIFIPDIHPYNINFKKKINNFENIFWLYLEKLPFSQNLPYCGINKTVASVGLQILAYLGFNPIYLIGMDLEYKDHISVKKNNPRNWTSTSDNDPNHFDPRYFGKGRKYHHPRLKETFKRLKEGKLFFDNLNIFIYNATIGGKLEIFPRKKFKSLFSIDSRKEFDLFKENILNKVKNDEIFNYNAKDIYSFISSNSLNSSINRDIDNKANIIVLGLDEAINCLNELIFTHVPFGPYDNKYIFIKREIINNN